jgi:putative membrane protein
MTFFANFMTLVVAILHLGIMILEMFFWTHPIGQKIFLTTPEIAETSATLAMNQGLYNGILAVGLLWGLVTGNKTLKVYLLLSIVVVGIFGAITFKISILYIQALPAFIGLLLVIRTRRRQAGETRLFS